MSERGFLGVDLFFVLSGYLIVTLLLRERDRNGSISLPDFYMRRVLRIFPVYYGLLFVVIIAFDVVFRSSDPDAALIRSMPWYFTFTSNFLREETLLFIAWSLATEEQFYLVWPPIEKFLGRFVMPILVVLLIANQLINYQVIFANHHGHLEVLQSTFTPILLGVLLAHVLHAKKGYETFAKVLGGRWGAVVAAAALFVIVNVDPVGSDISGTPRLLIHLVMTAFLAACVLNESHMLAPVLKLRPVLRIGAVSYGIYLFHMFVLVIANVGLHRVGLGAIPGVLFVTTLVGTFIVAELSFRFYEMPFLRLKHRWAS